MLKKCVIVAVVVVVVVLVGLFSYEVGKNDTIHQAELVEVTDSEYYISFDGEVHIYTFE